MTSKLQVYAVKLTRAIPSHDATGRVRSRGEWQFVTFAAADNIAAADRIKQEFPGWYCAGLACSCD